jgi:hypothetical protein
MEVDNMPNGTVIDLEDNRSIARRKRRGGSNSTLQRDSQNEPTSTQPHGIATPPATPHRSKKRVRFSDPGPSSSTGLTPFFSQISISIKITPTLYTVFQTLSMELVT